MDLLYVQLIWYFILIVIVMVMVEIDLRSTYERITFRNHTLFVNLYRISVAIIRCIDLLLDLALA